MYKRHPYLFFWQFLSAAPQMLNGDRASPFPRSVFMVVVGLSQPGSAQSQKCWAVEESPALQVFKKSADVALGDTVTCSLR